MRKNSEKKDIGLPSLDGDCVYILVQSVDNKRNGIEA